MLQIDRPGVLGNYIPVNYHSLYSGQEMLYGLNLLSHTLSSPSLLSVHDCCYQLGDEVFAQCDIEKHTCTSVKPIHTLEGRRQQLFQAPLQCIAGDLLERYGAI